MANALEAEQQKPVVKSGRSNKAQKTPSQAPGPHHSKNKSASRGKSKKDSRSLSPFNSMPQSFTNKMQDYNKYLVMTQHANNTAEALKM